jgi:acyl-coenzyme A synthetase/AMP-(fatty) acid ligase
MYRTGDVVRRSASGDLEFLYRADRQLKVRGYRIEPAEIEASLATHPAVREAAVVACDDVLGDKRLVAYLVLRNSEAPVPAELSQHLRQSLPAHMIPSEFVTLDRLPLSANGKIDRHALARAV